MTSFQPLHDPRDDLADMDEAALRAREARRGMRDLRRVEAERLRTITTILHGRTAAAPGEASG